MIGVNFYIIHESGVTPVIQHWVILTTFRLRFCYEAVRFAWRVDKSRVKKADYILPFYNGTIVRAFVADEWMEVSPENTPSRLKRRAFVGHEASQKIQNIYEGMPLPDRLKTISRNPVKYANC